MGSVEVNEMEDFLFSIELVKAHVLEDYRTYFPNASKKKPMVHWGVEYEIRFMDAPIPEEPEMALSRRFMEITLKADENPTPAIIAREMVMRGGHSVGAAAVKARDGWWNGKKPQGKKGITAQEAKELLDKTGHVPDEMVDEEELDEDHPALELGKAVKAAMEPPKRTRQRTKRKSH